MPNLCRAGVTSTCRTAVQALACMDPLKQLLAAKQMLKVGAGAWASAPCDKEVHASHQLRVLGAASFASAVTSRCQMHVRRLLPSERGC